MTPNHKRALFGGTLMAAGLIAPAAQAQFNFSYSYARAYAREYGYFTNDSAVFGGSGPFSIQADASSPYATAHGDVMCSPSSVGTHASITGNGGFAYGFDLVSTFTVGQNTVASVDWDWSQSYGYLRIDDQTLGSTIFIDFGSGSGSTPLALDSTHTYFFTGYSAARGQGDHSTYWEVTVPAPGSAGLLGLAGLTAARRRRTTPRNC